jgi:hypothetical protein
MLLLASTLTGFSLVLSLCFAPTRTSFLSLDNNKA